MRNRTKLARTYGALIAAYIVLAIAELSEATRGLKVALLVDGLHNASEIVPLGLCLIEHRRQSNGHKLSGIPRFAALMTFVVAIVVAPFALHQHSHIATSRAIELTVFSLALNAGGALRIEKLSSLDDHNAEGAVIHLLGDGIIAGSALLAYSIIAMGASRLCDPIAILVGTAIAAFLNIRFVHRHGESHAHMRTQKPDLL